MVVSDDARCGVGFTVSDFEKECLAALARIPRGSQQSLHDEHKRSCGRVRAAVYIHNIEI